KQGRIEPVLSRFPEDKPVFPGQRIEFEMIAGATRPVRLELETALVEIGEPIFELVNKALLVVRCGIAAAPVTADGFELELAGIDLGQLNLEVGVDGPVEEEECCRNQHG